MIAAHRKKLGDAQGTKQNIKVERSEDQQRKEDGRGGEMKKH